MKKSSVNGWKENKKNGIIIYCKVIDKIFSTRGVHMKISAEEIKKIALLSRLEIQDNQIDSVGKQLNDILTYMDLISQVDISDVEPTGHAVSMRNVMREDVPQPSLANEKALQNAPEQENGYFKVPKVIQD
jgi:aspartyl-tRNA(Asn)/glutamyl-tRNA(Gln) amidotransferase subunit C